MNWDRSKILMVLAMVVLGGCKGEPEDTRAQDERAIRAADAGTLKAAQGKDVDGILANYAEDAAWLPPNAEMVTGKRGIRAGWAQFIDNPGFNIDWQIDKVEVARSGDLAYVLDSYQLALVNAQGKTIDDHGKDMAVWKKQADGSWKITAESFSSDVPAVAAAPKKAEPRHTTKRKASKKRRRTA
jgi:uncharacterized protein (TIGR02246 family)